MTTQMDPLPHSIEGLAMLQELGEAIEDKAAKVLLESLLLATMEAIGWDHPQVLNQANVHLSVSLGNRTNEQDDTSPAATASLPEWLRDGRRAVLLPDLSWFLDDVCRHLSEWTEGKPPAVLDFVIELITRDGFATFPQGPFPLNYHCQWQSERALPARLAQSLPEAHDLLRLLSLRDGDWEDAGGNYVACLWGDPSEPDDAVMDLRTACERALDRGDPSLADMLLGCWLMFMFLGTRRALPHVSDVGRIIRRIPAEDRVSINAVLGLIKTELAADAQGARRLSHLLSYLPPVLAFTPSEPEAELRAHLGDEAWEWLSAAAQKVLLDNERLFRDWRRLGGAEADARGPTKLLPHWAAVFELLLRRALRRCDRELALEITDKMPLGELLKKVEDAWKFAKGWPAEDVRRRHLVGDPWLDMLRTSTRQTRDGASIWRAKRAPRRIGSTSPPSGHGSFSAARCSAASKPPASQHCHEPV